MKRARSNAQLVIHELPPSVCGSLGKHRRPGSSFSISLLGPFSDDADGMN